jgi:hypothetical protein
MIAVRSRTADADCATLDQADAAHGRLLRDANSVLKWRNRSGRVLIP